MRLYKWRTAPTGTEGTQTMYADSYTGSDIYGNGTRSNPFRTITACYNKNNRWPSKIILRGVFSENVSTGSHGTEINGDYYGAAVFDGQNVHVLYGFGHNNLIIRRVAQASATTPVYYGSVALAGVGRAGGANRVGLADHVTGVCGSSALLAECALYYGCIGGISACSHIVYSKPTINSTYRISFNTYSNAILPHITVYDVPKEKRQKAINPSGFVASVFGKVAFIANEPSKINFNKCVFLSDCEWWYFPANTYTSAAEQIDLSGVAKANRAQYILDFLTEKGVAAASQPSFTDCIFSDETSAQTFNDAEGCDFTLVPGCDADAEDSYYGYYGALPPALKVAIKNNSTGVVGSWDENSASGCVLVDNNKICIDTNSQSLTGSILSKIIAINPKAVQLNGIYSLYESIFQTHKAYLNSNSILGSTYNAGDTLPQGRYIAKGVVNYGGVEIDSDEIIVVSADDTTFSAVDAGAQLLAINEPNVMDCVYVRCRQAIYATVKPTDTLQSGATYLNTGNETITFHGRSIASGESFVCMYAGESFTASSNNYEIAIMFDDTRVPDSADWVPAQLFGEYFVAKQNGAIQKDEFNVPLGSGNYMSYQSGALAKSTMDRKYIQFKIALTRYGNS